jgi:predicted peroxiredoxin
MTETTTVAPLSAPQNKEDFKSFFLQLLEEDVTFYYSIKAKFLVKEEKAKKKVKKKALEPLPPAIPFSEMPASKLYPNRKPFDAKPYVIKKEAILKLQELWKDAPPIEELIAQLNS